MAAISRYARVDHNTYGDLRMENTDILNNHKL